jgi:hypothetical protein
VNQKDTYKSNEPVPNYLHDVTVKDKKLTKGMEATLERGVGRYPAGRYRFAYALRDTHGQLWLTFFGPSRRAKQRYRIVSEDAVRTVHK